MLKSKIILVLLMYLIMGDASSATLSDINVVNSVGRSIVTLGFDTVPIYAFFLLHNPERVVMDIHQSDPVQGLPINFSGGNLIKRIRTSTPVDKRSVRIVFELTGKSRVQAMTQQVIRGYNVVITATEQQLIYTHAIGRSFAAEQAFNAASFPDSKIKNSFTNTVMMAKNSASVPVLRKHIPAVTETVVVAIDAGHGGKDPGATGPNGLHEKNVTIAIARQLKELLDVDPMFKAVLTRDGDYFISVMGRSDVARKKGARVLVSIHADAAPNRRVSGASVWVLSNRRAYSEMANWLEQHEKQSELLGGAGDLLANSQADLYLSQAVLDLQFGHSQRVGYDIALKVLCQLQNIGALHKRLPEHASLGVLRSPDIPSLLVETGFISNIQEARLLGNSAYQKKIANAIYLGLRAYFLAHPLQLSPKLEKHGIWSGQRLRIPANCTTLARTYAAVKPYCHKVVRGDTLSAISSHYGVSAISIMRANNMKSGNVILGQTLIIPTV
ncbi:MAG: N-acetylmuramoyl-L-alanine amidase B [Sodalis sp. Fse]|nr:MAG: N-acetylmuramoyl-L-alanine amidase B [Sodalis sp. Fse]